ncbi:MAG: efflux transporter periplasmic adaptor subunit, partial [Candidatus Ratteibacteria bacterium]
MRIKYGSRFIITIQVLVIGLILMTGCGKTKEGAGPQPGGVPEVSVVIMQPERVTITTELPGRTSAFLVAEVRPQVNGIVQKRLFTEGGNVKQGDILYQID